MSDDSFAKLCHELDRCRQCPRLTLHREEVARVKRRAYLGEEYWGRPVPGFGDPAARLVLVGLAPGAHGSNRTGRMFTGDASGDTLYEALHAHGFASSPVATSRQDGLELRDCFITAAARCAPPGNHPTVDELANCAPYLEREFRLLARARVYVTLGQIAHLALSRLLDRHELQTLDDRSFGHDRWSRWVPVSGTPAGARPLHVIASYHPSRQNTQTGRLTRAMFHAVFARAKRLLSASPSD